VKPISPAVRTVIQREQQQQQRQSNYSRQQATLQVASFIETSSNLKYQPVHRRRRKMLSRTIRVAGSRFAVSRRFKNPTYTATPINQAFFARYFAAMSENDLKKRLDEFQDLFVEARLSIEDCQDSAGTKYFDEEAEAAQEAVDDAVKSFEKLISDIDDDDQKNRILRGNGLKVEQLKGELEMAVHGGHDH
jgi:hypothetical protein